LSDISRFQQNLDFLDKWGMSLNIFKGRIISFNSVDDTPNYTLNKSVLDYLHSTKYLGVTLQLDCMFNTNISKNIRWQKTVRYG